MNDDTSKRRCDVLAAGEDRALDALTFAWGDEYDEIWVSGGLWCARHRNAAEDEILTRTTPEELNAAIRADWARAAC
jgi:hypothetical protein